MILGFRGQRMRHALPELTFAPRAVHVLHKGEGQENGEIDEAHQEHQHGEYAAEIRCERNVAEAQRGHDREAPVHAGEPGLLLPLVDHEEVEADGEERDDQHEDQEITPDRRDVLLFFLAVSRVRNRFWIEKCHRIPRIPRRLLSALAAPYSVFFRAYSRSRQ